MYKSITLTEEEMVQLDDGQGWYKAGDNCLLEGYMPDDDNEAGYHLQLGVNGEEPHDNWIHFSDLPKAIQERMLNA